MAVTSKPIIGCPDWTMLVPAWPVVVSPSASAQHLYDGPCVFFGASLSIIGIGALLIKDDNSTGQGGNTICSLAGSAPLGPLAGIPSCGIHCSYGITIPAGATAPTFTLFFRPLPTAYPYPY